ncbi:hypothetical protein B0H13DRAFT_1518519, partial [Mycena leptocephala]
PSTASDGIPAYEILRFTCSELTQDTFREVWAQGDPILVTGAGEKLKLAWDPQYFIEKYGGQNCEIVECETQGKRDTTVEAFFQHFGVNSLWNGKGQTPQCWKLKDWPPASDFSSTFPELYEDFSVAVPMPNYVRRDGVLNIASHFPSNMVCPDLGALPFTSFSS